ncbi:uncharacterized protein G2W53_029364 [Senna tora]|uniref:Uncharacterized protein n=1 Tax=Senna tora TaxID=362788 RepID=A0A834T4F9_9FABA|nr:uncharacterized protein G2W53_029364 [Senna tora]
MAKVRDPSINKSGINEEMV